MNNKRYSPNSLWGNDVLIAIELKYPKEAIDALDNEPDPLARQRILHDARIGKYDNKSRK